MALTAQEQLKVNNWFVAATRGGAAAVKQGIANLLKVPAGQRDEVQKTLLNRLRAWRAPVVASKLAPIATKIPAPVPQQKAGPTASQIEATVKATRYFGQTFVNKIKSGQMDKVATVNQYQQRFNQEADGPVKMAMLAVLQDLKAAQPTIARTDLTKPAPKPDVVQPTVITSQKPAPLPTPDAIAPIESTDPADDDFVFDDPIYDPWDGFDFSVSDDLAQPSTPQSFDAPPSYSPTRSNGETTTPAKAGAGVLAAAALAIGSFLYFR